MIAGILAGMTWAIETIVLGIALAMTPFVSTEQAVILAPFVSTFIHDFFSAIWACVYNGVRGNLKNVIKALKTKSGKFVILAAVIGGPVGMTGYVLSINNMGASIGAVASAIFPAIGAVLAYIFLKEKMQWYRWILLILTMLGVYGLSYSPEINIANFWLGFVGTLMCAFGWGFTVSLFDNTGWLIPLIALAALFATVSYLFYYKAISQIGASKSMALNVSYAAWAIVFTVIIFRDTSVLNPITILCSLVVLVCGILAAADYKDFIKK